ncbi:hypothetical protein H4R18_000556 [Coemansia javaensis]|uniref:Peptidase S9 prolyl oligopeptidase catalytic domain-containing protein n=1 Tax=Coemansia javaensis TaxID=2761396 RepID=A0A9W8LLX4_9FUNG|nr:hypothetical protein H4R18_000556 [Coemansia javaensis]
MSWAGFRRRVRRLRGAALGGWPASVAEVHLQATDDAVHVWCACTAPAQGLRRSTAMHAAVPVGSGSAPGSGSGGGGGGGWAAVPVAALRSVWADGDSCVGAACGGGDELRALQGAGVEHMLWAGGGASVVVVGDRGRLWAAGHVEYPRGGGARARFAGAASGGGGGDDWYYARGGRGGRLVAFVRGRNVVVCDAARRSETQVTWAADDGVQYGAVDRAVEEELGRATGLFWAPGAAERLLCARVDERAVAEIGLPDAAAGGAGGLVAGAGALFADDDGYGWAHGCPAGRRRLGGGRQRWPRPGAAVAATDWAVVELGGAPRVRTLLARARLQALFPWAAYAARAGWLPGGGAVWLQLLDRAQRRAAVVRVPLACFDAGCADPVDPLADGRGHAAGPLPRAARVDVLYEERQPAAWINVAQGPRFLADAAPGCVRFVIASERAGGFCHLYLVTSHLAPPGAARTEIAALTRGAWPVAADGPLVVDEPRRLVFFAARRPNPLTANLFAVSYAAAAPHEPPPEPAQLTPMGYTHAGFVFDASRSFFFCQSSNLSTPVRHCVYRIAAGAGGAVAARCLAVLEPACPAGLLGAAMAADDGDRDRDHDHAAPPRPSGARAERRLSSSSLSSLSVESLAPDEYFVERLLAKLRAGGQQIQHSALASDLARLKRLTPAYVSQRVTRAVKSALPFCSAPTVAPLHLLHSTLFPQPPPQPPQPRPPLLPPPVGRPRPSSLTAASVPFAVHETLVGSAAAALPPRCPHSGDPVPRLFAFPVPRAGPAPGHDLLFGHVFLPPAFRPGVRYPVVVNAYGGPQCQLVTNAYAYPRHRRLAMLARMVPELAEDDEGYGGGAASPWARPQQPPPPPPPLGSDDDDDDDADDDDDDDDDDGGPRPDVAAMQPVVVVCVDGRGTPFRGLAFEAAIRGRMGQIEVDDIVSALDYLCHYGLDCLATTTRPAPRWCRAVVSTSGAAVPRPPVFAPPGLPPGPPSGADCWDPAPDARAVRPFVDRARVAIHGWSYGGYVALRAMAQHPALFRAAVAGAPVVRWDWYCAAYTERYLGLPADDPAAYARASALAHADRLAPAAARLLLVHGWGDDNVHVAHTAALVRDLRRRAPHAPAVRVAAYAAERHGLRLPASNEHFETLLSFWLFHALAHQQP